MMPLPPKYGSLVSFSHMLSHGSVVKSRKLSDWSIVAGWEEDDLWETHYARSVSPSPLPQVRYA